VYILVLALLAFWLLTAFPVARFTGDLSQILLSGVAAGLCLVPTALTLVWGRWALRQPPQQQLTMVLGGTGVRMAVVLVAAFALSSQPVFQQQSFWIWLVVAYVYSLGVEMVLLLTGRPALGVVPPAPGTPASTESP
jgi:hypothetical protein